MVVYLQTVTGSIELSVEKNESIASVKAKLHQKEGIPQEFVQIFDTATEKDDSSVVEDGDVFNVVVRVCGGVMMEPTLQVLARKFNCEKMICRKCYARLPPRATNCRSKQCGRTNQIRPKKKLKG
eukprot:TRINITY_DN9680_c0_g1_i2.p2 TRINITY_DN9680_c0_g1~~TRINITY_DN9680_c0_g1_i2.p2  ORF type:complete len:125 (-),score=21.02 TRINITY_DN9680_c0_g1_i2:52-426(-)